MESWEFSSRNPELAINDWNLQSTVRNPESETQVLVYLTLGKRISAIMQVLNSTWIHSGIFDTSSKISALFSQQSKLYKAIKCG